jgi:hypothetical protein
MTRHAALVSKLQKYDVIGLILFQGRSSGS